MEPRPPPQSTPELGCSRLASRSLGAALIPLRGQFNHFSRMNHPVLYEINTRCWLQELSDQHGQTIFLGEVPAEVFADWLRLGFTHIWLMGVWITGPRSRARGRIPLR